MDLSLAEEYFSLVLAILDCIGLGHHSILISCKWHKSVRVTIGCSRLAAMPGNQLGRSVHCTQCTQCMFSCICIQHTHCLLYSVHKKCICLCLYKVVSHFLLACVVWCILTSEIATFCTLCSAVQRCTVL